MADDITDLLTFKSHTLGLGRWFFPWCHLPRRDQRCHDAKGGFDSRAHI